MSTTRQKDGLEKLHRLAEEKGGKCLATEYKKSYNKYLLECAEGHQWEARLSSLMNGSWCPVCAKEHKSRQKYTLEDMQLAAKKHGGRCLSKEYISSALPLEWECKNKHSWSMVPKYILNGRWCRQCQRETAGKEILENMHKLAAERNGRCLSNTYEKRTIKLKWECQDGHVWEAPPGSIVKGSWCPVCARNKVIKKNITIEDMQELAAKRGGKCLSTTYVNSSTKLEWECEKGHRWLALHGNIRSGTWCKECALEKRKVKGMTIEIMQKWAEEKGGQCLSKEYTNMTSQLIWQCQKEHVWLATPRYIEKGKWCPKCKPQDKKKPRITIEDMQNIAKRNRGFCLSTEYDGLNKKLEWKCEHNHTWLATPREVRGGSWCPECYKHNYKYNRYSIAMMQEWAATYGGFCLSQEYTGLTGELEWQCIRAHKWSATPQKIKQGHWCPECAKLSQSPNRRRRI